MTAVDGERRTEEAPYVSADEWHDDDDRPRRPVRKRLGPWSLLLCGAVVGTAAFLGGVLVEKHDAKAAPAASGFTRTRGGAGAAGGAQTGAGAAGTGAAGTGAAAGGQGTGAADGVAGAARRSGGGAGVGATIGTIKLIDGPNVYVADATGTVTKISTTAQSTITLTTTGSISDLKPGDTVIATGSTAADGTVTATAVRDQGAARGAGAGARGG